jgi:peptidoglycan/xylan/chitin deacetylase (PgdA/CDA1 family)
MIQLAIKVDVDTERGTRVGVPNLLTLFEALKIPSTFLFSLGPDNTGRALKRIFRPGFLKKVSRTSVLQVYGLQTLLNGILWPGPHIAHRHANILKHTEACGHEVGIHCYDHVYWQDYLGKMTREQVFKEVEKAQEAFVKIRRFVTRFSGPRFVGELVKGESCIAQAWSGEAQLAQQQAEDAGRDIHIRYVVPKEGAVLWIDTIASPKDAPHPLNAHKFIDFLLRPEIAARISNEILLPTTILASHKMISPKLLADQTVFPPREIMDRLKLDKPQSEAYEKLRTRAWLQAKLLKF